VLVLGGIEALALWQSRMTHFYYPLGSVAWRFPDDPRTKLRECRENRMNSGEKGYLVYLLGRLASTAERGEFPGK
jgi:hypothetical protein